MTRGAADRPSFLRVALAGVVIVDLFSFFLFLGDARAIGAANGTLNAFNDLVSTAPVRGAVILLGIAGAVAFARRPGRLWAGVLPLAALALLSTVHAQLFGSPWRHLYYSGVCLSGWLLGLAVTRRQGAATDESYARMGSIALLSAAYFNAGISKLVFGGFDWLSGLPIQEVIVGQDGLVADGLVSLYRSWVVNNPAVASLFSLTTVGFELAAPLMIAGRRPRVAVALGLFAMHTNIYVLTPILYWESMALLLLFGLSPDPPRADSVPGSAAAFPSNRVFAGAAVLLILCALVAIGHQGRRFAAVEAARAPASGPAIASAPASARPQNAAPPAAAPESAPTPTSPPSLRQIGPLTVGQPLADGWTIDSVELRDESIFTTLSGPRGRVVFETTCAASEHHSPFDLGAAHILYSSELKFQDLKAVGWALRTELEQAADGRDACEAVASWLTSARADDPR